MSRERPIVMCGESVRGILEGRKTQTRRIVTPQPYETEMCPVIVCVDVQSPSGYTFASDRFDDRPIKAKCKVDDRLWVRENIWLHKQHNLVGDKNKVARYYDADMSQAQKEKGRWLRNWYDFRTSRFMPKWAARIWLQITNIRVERLQEIKFFDIRAEGFDCPEHDFPGGMCVSECRFLRNAFSEYWDFLNAKRGFGWDINPWVWVIEFERIDARCWMHDTRKRKKDED